MLILLQVNWYKKAITLLLSILSLFIFNSSGFSQQEDIYNLSTPAKSSSAVFRPLKDIDSLVIPLKRSGRLFLLEANVDGVSGNLIFDTGASGLVLNQTYFRDHLKLEGKASNGITGGISSEERVNVDMLEISELSYKGLTASLANLGHIENRRGIQVSGLFGFEMLRGFEIILDLQHDLLKLYRVNKKGERVSVSSGPFLPQFTEKFEFINNVIILKARMGGKNLNFCMDTGAEMNAVNSFASKNVLKTLTVTSRTKLHGVGSVTNEVLYGTMSDFYIGNQSLPGMETIISNLSPLSEVYGLQIDGMLGYSFLTKGIFCINFAKKQIGYSFFKPDKL